MGVRSHTVDRIEELLRTQVWATPIGVCSQVKTAPMEMRSHIADGIEELLRTQV